MESVSARFGTKVAEIRKMKGLSQESVAVLASVDRSYLSRVERGVMKITLDKAMDIANALDCSLCDLI